MTDNPHFWRSAVVSRWQSKNCFESTDREAFGSCCCWQRSCYMRALPNSLTCLRHSHLEDEARALAAHAAAYALGVVGMLGE